MTEAAEVLDPQMPPEQPDPRDIARAVAMDVADEPEQVGEVVNAIELDDNVTDFRLAANVRGYEGWQWSVTLYHDVEVGTWTVNESSLVPTDDALMPPAWVPWKDRLEPTDLAPTDSIGTDPDDPRLEGGFRKTEPVAGMPADEVEKSAEKLGEKTETTGDASEDSAKSEETAEQSEPSDSAEPAEQSAEQSASTDSAESAETQDAQDSEEAAKAAAQAREAQETEEIVEEFQLSRRHVLSPQGRAQVAKRWYEGPRGPKAMSTKTADGNLCSTCGFFVPLQGDLNRMFGVCANKWSPDDGRVVSIDHGCGEHSEIEPPEPSHLWVQSKPAYDDFHIDVIAQKPRDERGAVEAIEQSEVESQDSDEATEEDILANTEPDTGDDEPDNAQPSGVDASAELEAVVSVAADGDEAETSEEPEASDTSEKSEADGAEDAEEAEAEETESDESKSDEPEQVKQSAEVAESKPAETETTEPETSDAEEPADANNSAEAPEETKTAEAVALTDLDKQVEAVDATIEDAAASLAAEIDDEVKDALAEAESAETEAKSESAESEEIAETVETVEVAETTETVEPAEAEEPADLEESAEPVESDESEAAAEPVESDAAVNASAETAVGTEASAELEEPADSAESAE